MGLVLYLFAAVAFVMIVGWALYVLPLPGALTPWELTGAFVPALIILGGVLVGVLAIAALGWLVGRLRKWRVRTRRRPRIPR